MNHRTDIGETVKNKLLNVRKSLSFGVGSFQDGHHSESAFTKTKMTTGITLSVLQILSLLVIWCGSWESFTTNALCANGLHRTFCLTFILKKDYNSVSSHNNMISVWSRHERKWVTWIPLRNAIERWSLCTPRLDAATLLFPFTLHLLWYISRLHFLF